MSDSMQPQEQLGIPAQAPLSGARTTGGRASPAILICAPVSVRISLTMLPALPRRHPVCSKMVRMSHFGAFRLLDD